MSQLPQVDGTEPDGRVPGLRVGAIWAQDRTGVLGADGAMLWRVPADFQHFKAVTVGGVIIMGRATWDSVGAPLPGRRSVVLTRQPGWAAEGATAVGSLEEALSTAADLLPRMGEDPREPQVAGYPRTWVIGGGSVYAQALAQDLVDELVITRLDLDASQRACERGLKDSDLVRAPEVDPTRFRLCAQDSDSAGQWRPVSGDAPWRVERWMRN